ncbi:MAG: tetratricopeptide repeat protein [Bacteroidetes bacterium]|nr:tetratricopeptide repeat protein [Bacteroidota bacterium]
MDAVFGFCKVEKNPCEIINPGRAGERIIYFHRYFLRYCTVQNVCMPLYFRFFFLLIFLQTLAFGQSGPVFRQTPVNLIRKGAYVEALEYLNIAIQQERGAPELYFLRGYAKYGLDDFIGAEQDYSQSIELSPYLADVFTNRAIVRSQLQNFKGSLEDFDKALEMDGSNGEIWFHRARTNLLLKKYYSCIVDCNKAIQLHCQGEGVYIIRASAEQEIKRYTEAIEDLDMARKINPQNGYVFSQRGLVWTEMNQSDSAIRDFSRAIALDTTNTFAMFNRALAWLKKSEQVAALKDLNAVIRISPYNSYAYYNRAIVLIGLNEKRGAINDFNIVSKLDPKNITSYYYRSKLKSELGDYSGALEDLDKTIALLPDYTDAWFDRYEVKIKLRDTKGAQADYRQALELTRKNHLDPDSLKAERKDYLKSLVKLSGDFEEMNTLNSKLQNQSVDIQLKPMYSLLLWKADFGKVKLYDGYKKEHYFTNILTLTNETGLISDSLLRIELHRQTLLIDSAGTNPDFHFRRAISYFQMRNYDRALADLNAALGADSGYITAWFSRAGARYELIQILNSQEDYQQEIILGKNAPKLQNPNLSATLEHTYEAVIRDLDKVLALDPEFSFAWYNRGYVNSRMGNYRAAIGDFSKAITLNNNFAEAFYNRGLMSILVSENHQGCLDLSRAGELGITDAYKVMKRYCYK